MAIVDTDWSINRTTKEVRYIGNDHTGGSPSYATVIQFHRWLQDLADDAVYANDDEMDITDLTPSDRSTDNIITLINGYNIDDEAAEHLYDGSIIQDGGNVIYDGIVNFGNTTNIQLLQNGAVLADDWWNEDPAAAGFGLNSDAGAGISHRFMIKVRTGSADVDGRRLIGTSRQFGFTYSEFSINGTSRGNNVLALSEANDLNNNTDSAVAQAWVDNIVNQVVGYAAIDVDNNAVDEHYYSQWTRAGFTINQVYERAKLLTREGGDSDFYGISGELFRGITHEISYTGLNGTFDEADSVGFANGATGQVLADNGVDTVWIQLKTGVAPTSGDLILQVTPDSASASTNVVTDRSGTISTPFIGQSTGSAIIGAYGVGFLAIDLTSADTVFALENPAVAVNPPNFVTFTVFGVDPGDRVLVGPATGSALNYSQLSLASDITTDDIVSLTVTGLIPTDTPSTGTIRVEDSDGLYHRLEYSAYADSDFTISSTDGQEDFAATPARTGDNVFISYIDSALPDSSGSFTSVYLSDRSLFIRVRDGDSTDPIKTFETTGTLGTAGGSTTAIRTSDL